MIKTKLPKNRYIRTKVKVFNAPVFVHWSVILAVVLLAILSFKTLLSMVLVVASYLSIIFVHEIGHAFIASKLGAEVYAIRVGCIHGCCEYEDSGDKWDNALIAWGGVLAQLIIAVPLIFLSSVFGLDEFGKFSIVVIFLGYFSASWAVMNMAPTYPLDGMYMWKIIPMAVERFKAKRKAQKAIDNIFKRKS